MTVTESLVAFSTSAPDAAPARVPVLVATLVDTVGVALPGVAELPALQRWDAADPAPGGATVWGRGTAQPYDAAQKESRIAALRDCLKASLQNDNPA